MYQFRRVNNLVGWIVFAISAITYLLTIEPSASFWDCGEFISSSYKLEVGHPPGAPFFMLMGRLFTMLAPGVTQVSAMVNAMSALASAFTILFLFWTITHFARKITGDPTGWNRMKYIPVIGSGVVGALAYAFSDTFWFSAVEGEVYATSSLLTAIVFWAILKWEDCAEEKYSNRWLVLIAYLMGLSIGVHLLNLLAIPAIGLVYYFKKYEPTLKGSIRAFLISCAILALIIWIIIPGTFVIATKFELLFVNGFGLPYNSGAIFWLLFVVAAVTYGIYYTYIHKKPLLNTAFLCCAMILIGYSSYGVIVIRSSEQTPMNQNNPSDPFSLLYYLNREQYGDRPLLYGPYYNAPIVSSEDGKPVYAKRNGKYEVVSRSPKYTYDPRFMTIFPRMYDSRDASHPKEYASWGQVKGTQINVASDTGEESETLIRPSFVENIRYFFSYQLNFMYFRYFMWNFAGRQNDQQGLGGPLQGNWLSGIPFLDAARLGPQKELPDAMANNPGRNQYYMLPFILGLLGLFWHLGKNRNDFWAVLLLFFMTGIAIVLYLNQTPLQPRERDYAYAGSFYAFSIWIGLGVMAIIETIPSKYRKLISVSAVVVITLLFVPGLMARENWDDHDRSDRYTARDFGRNYLESCAPNAIIFTNGDNDTFPLWYNQEVEGVRTDVRVVNLSYLGADWYIDQMQRKAYESEPLPFSMKSEKYQAGNRDVMYVLNRMDGYQELKDVMAFVASDDPRTKTLPNTKDKITYAPSSKFKITIDSAQVVQTGTVPAKDAAKIVKEMKWELPKESLYQGMVLFKNSMMVLDLLAENNWKRPVYFAITVSTENYLGLDSYFRLDGFGYRVVPVQADSLISSHEYTSVDTDILYDNLMNKSVWGNIEKKDVYLDENILRMIANYRNLFGNLAEALNNEGKTDKAVEVLDRCLSLMPHARVPYNHLSFPMIEQYFRAGASAKAEGMMNTLYEATLQNLNYYKQFKGSYLQSIETELRIALYTVNTLGDMADKYKLAEFKGKTDAVLEDWTRLLSL